MGKDIFKLTIPGKPDYISVARLTSSAIASKIGLNLEEIEDIKVALSEACTNALKKVDEINIQFVIDDEKFTMIVENALLPIESDDISTKELEMGILIMKSLMDEVKFYNEGVELIKYIKDGNKDEHKLSI
jgi:serine/threonine-protein kinase RsbW